MLLLFVYYDNDVAFVEEMELQQETILTYSGGLIYQYNDDDILKYICTYLSFPMILYSNL